MASAINSVMSALHLGGKKDESAPQPPTEEQYKDLKDTYAKAEQGQVFQFWDDLEGTDKAALYKQLKNIDPVDINRLAEKALNPPEEKDDDKKPTLEQLPESATSSVIDSKSEDLKSWYDQGLSLIADNKVGVVLMAGGQGTRLGSSAPKGCYNIGLPSEKSLFQLQAERIWKLQKLAAATHNKEDVIIPWYIMTSGPTRKPTEQFFEENKYFGLHRDNVIFFEQGTLPCIDMKGKILLESKGKVAVAPDGNGGLYLALVNSGIVEDLTKRGIKHIHAYCVDNCLVRVADPTFIGFSAGKEVDIATKVVRKRNAKESVGLILQKNGKPDVVEYSEISSELAEAKDAKDSSLLKFRAANIVNHYYSYSFLESIPQWVHKLPHHVAKKKIPTVDEKGNAVKPEKPNGIKLEQFVFDCFPFLAMEKFACMEVKREDEFSPLKNARGTGEDDPDTSKRDILEQGRRFLEQAGATVTSEEPEAGVEVSPLVSYGGEGLSYMKGQHVKAPAVIEKQKRTHTRQSIIQDRRVVAKMSSLSRRACFKCGDLGHYAQVCTNNERLCYNCKEPGHESNTCPHPRTTETKQCYSCQDFGHVQADCPSSRLNGGSSGGKCYSCGQVGHLARDCPSPNTASALQLAEAPEPLEVDPVVALKAVAVAQSMKCYACGKNGHISRDCTNATGSATASAGKTCYRCNKPGHISRDCPQSFETNDAAPAAADATIDTAAEPTPAEAASAPAPAPVAS
ncbi:hypothetical protein AMS68_002522 [Peltaster fructicola]|uniref:UDP-N-acetylglucosamine diphosphorylase n=1 Tax=Peltaster fructicola TaxID=286661 RepID=A0A6H0XQU2_9PEZI|nr:hypothetical protein AMS68_002522 [Peltaster fructicola]